MKNNNLIRFAQSLVLLPVMTISLSLSGIHNIRTPQNVLAQKVNIEADGSLALNQAVNPEADLRVKNLEARAKAIDAYFAKRDMPLEGVGMKMVQAAEDNDLDWRLLPAIAVRESTGGKNACDRVENNSFGWGSCKIGFKSNEEAIKTVAKNLGGNNPNTAHHYDNKTIKQILRAYNPPYIVPRYAEQVMSIMKAIGTEDMAIKTEIEIAVIKT
ncbi:MAG: hypothetical protein UU82_C0010G0011 [Candidatus Nomurabacteria bacterium GW2011_GWC2_41_8]|uniref:Mannosyl-glycoprotein endo-beta-N-acetylglucosamidase-like domain-containing protein n=3 Tax=Candidatus Nomuraibacteriota TaxID=1752729 RepID=A0A1F6YCW0_9BACT|nr:MAG: hypothetical protein UU58_C0004G0027 [Candidatus Nomurabacteria bacterium GW2011_GWA2_41_25]KKS24163.1 MAG: hypothetical protein UU82_C0010G0011 [Candidatus Nomurabacteria bacterium GW2011_GWC2_41_8]OGI67442.1 MAG: hypothetical protein A2823_00935 [Candidatus Nomurabacteria bacterium RIFCSPHIGHO2_01_FULL_41_91]OGI80547.1 MAG: hypothetical protein A3D43_02900 [Candidatus Nomurabacteria bacterium RIFCSPHIGHO2_02_FULL_41_52]OGI84673.1 MAG: hypothetical protein A3F49_02335 [Candidatus Nomur